MKLIPIFFSAFLLLSATSSAARPGSDPPEEEKKAGGDDGGGFGLGGFFGSGSGFNIPGFGGGFGAGYGGPSGGYGEGGVIRPSVVCSVKGPCYKKKLTCPAKCFYTYSHAGKDFGAGGGGGGGCTIDCQQKCVAYC